MSEYKKELNRLHQAGKPGSVVKLCVLKSVLGKVTFKSDALQYCVTP